jgi:hypothetical protein
MRPNQALERTAARCAFRFQMIETVFVKAALGSSGGRSALSRWVHEAMRRIAVTTLILAPTAAQSMADGQMFWREEIPPKIPYQRALILFDKGTESLILQKQV